MHEFQNMATPVFIYIVFPASGLVLYLILKKRMKTQKIISAPVWDMFVVFFTYGGLLTLALTSFFWYWSGLASLGAFYLLILAPIMMLIIAYRQYQKRKTSTYHKWMFYLGILYFIIAPLTFLALFHFAKN